MKKNKEMLLTMVPQWYHIAPMSLGLTFTIKTRVSKSFKREFDRAAKSLGKSTSELLREALREKVEETKAKESV